jgi:hypothetical protein
MRISAIAILAAMAISPGILAQEIEEPLPPEQKCTANNLIQLLGLDRARECASPNAAFGLDTATEAVSTQGRELANERSSGASEQGRSRAEEASNNGGSDNGRGPNR